MTLTEAKVVQLAMKHLKKMLPGAVVFKHNDLSTSGIPDLSINYDDRTVWLEVKVVNYEDTRSKFLEKFTKMQLASNIVLARQVRVYYLIAYEVRDQIRAVLYQPPALRRYLQRIGQSFLSWEGKEMEGELREALEWAVDVPLDFS